ncbi:MAG: MarR family transcriptional regulator [Rhizobiaceae bacterium]
MDKLQETIWNNPRFRNWVAVARACQAVERALAQALAPLGLKTAHLDMMMNIHRHPGMSQQDLANKLLVGRSNITMLLPQMETRGLVRRTIDKRDKRVLRLELTDDGEELLSKALRIHFDLVERVMAQSTPQECDTVGEQMRRIVDALTEDQDTARSA